MINRRTFSNGFTFQPGVFSVFPRRRPPHPQTRLGAPTAVDPMTLPLIEQRTLRIILAGRTRREKIARPARSKLSPVPVIVITPSIEQRFRTIRVALSLRTRVESERRRPRSSVLYPPAVIQGSALSVLRSPSTPSGLGAPIVHPALVLISHPPWRFIVTDLQSATITFLDRIARKRSLVYTLNTPAHANGIVDAANPEVNLTHTDGDPFVAEGNRLLYAFRREGGYDPFTGVYAPWVCRFAGPLLQFNDNVNQDRPESTFTAFDPWMYLMSRPVVHADGSLPGRDGLSYTGVTGDFIALDLLVNTINNHGSCMIDAGISNGGTSFYGMSGASLNMTAQIDINFQQGCSVGEAWTQLCETQTIDLVLRPVYDPVNRPGYCAELGIHQQVGLQRDGAIFAWDMPSRSLINLDRLEDGTVRANNMQFFLQGGIPATLQTDPVSIAKFGEWWAMQTFNGETTLTAVDSYALEQLQIRKIRSTSIRIDPAPERSPIVFNEYNIGDTVPIYASKRLRKPIGTPLLATGRIYTIPIDVDDNSVETVKQMDFSADSLTLS